MILRPAIELLVRLLPDRDDLRLHAREYLAAALSGLILRLAFPKFDLWPAAWIGMVPLFWSLRGRSGKAAFYRGWVFGAVYFYGVCFFLNTLYIYMGIVVVGIVLLAVISGLYCALFALGAAAIARRRPVLALAAIPAWWVALESIRSSGELGFPFGALAHSQWQVTSLIQIVSLAGTGAISFLIVLFNLALTRAIFDKAALSPRRRAAELALAILVVAVCWIYGRQTIGRRAAEEARESAHAIDVLMIQSNIPQPQKWESYQLYAEDHVEKAQAMWDEMLLRVIVPTDDALTSAVAANRPDLIVWPETAVPDYFYNLNPRYTDVIERKVRDWKTPLLFGSSRVVPAPDGRAIVENYNTAYLYLPDAPANPLYYDKRHLVPFGEDFSYFRYIPIMKIFGLDLGTFNRGSKATVFQIPVRGASRAAFSMVICFESTMPYLFRESVRNGAQFMVIVTNDAWYGSSSGAAQHQIQSVFRAVETRRWVCRCANTGVSCFISPEGRVEQRAGLNTTATLRARIAALDGQTLYVRLGPWFSWLCLLFSAVSFAGPLRPRAAGNLNK